METPVMWCAIKGSIHARFHLLPYLEVKIIANCELLAKIWAECSSMKVAKGFNEWLDGKMRATKVCDVKELKNSDCDCQSWSKWGAWNKAIVKDGGWNAQVGYMCFKVDWIGL